jgi:hypothetical protein
LSPQPVTVTVFAIKARQFEDFYTAMVQAMPFKNKFDEVYYIQSDETLLGVVASKFKATVWASSGDDKNHWLKNLQSMFDRNSATSPTISSAILPKLGKYTSVKLKELNSFFTNILYPYKNGEVMVS